MANKKTPKLLKATISGSFKATDGEIESFDNVTGLLPLLDDDKAQQMIIRRYAKIWIGQARKRVKVTDAEGKTVWEDTEEPKYKRVQRVREVFIDSVDEEEGKQLSYVGLNIMEMNYEELQDVAAAKDLIEVPLYKSTSLTQARRVAFCEYANKVLGMTEVIEVPDRMGGKPIKKEVKLDWRREGFKPSNYAAIIADDTIRRDGHEPEDIEEVLETENLLLKHGSAAPSLSGDSRLSLDQLKKIAKAKNISYNANIGYDALYRKIWPS